MIFIPDYSLTVEDQPLHFLFNTRALKRYCQSKGLEMEEFYVKIQKALPDAVTDEKYAHIKPFVLTDLGDLLLHGNESWCAYNKIPFAATDLDSDYWVDTIGGTANVVRVFSEILLCIIRKIVATPEKKSEMKVVQESDQPNHSHGTVSLSEPLRVG